MINPFEDKLFHYWQDDSKENTLKRLELIKENPPTIDQIVDFVAADVTSGKEQIEKLYYIYMTGPISSLVGWHVKPGNFGLGGYLKLEFYEKLLKKSRFVNHLFAFLPAELQTDELLVDYIQDKTVKDKKLGNYRGKKPSTSTLMWMIQDALGLVPEWKEDWWTDDLKALAIERDPAILAYIPKSLITIPEIKDFLKNHGQNNRQHMRQLWSNLPENFRMNPEIFGNWLRLNGGIANNFDELMMGSNSKYFNLPSIKKYFEYVDGSVFGEWKFIRKEWKEELIDVALPKVFGMIALDPDIELTDDILERTLNSPINDLRKAKIALRLQKEGRLTKELIERMKLKYTGIGSLSDTELVDLYKNPEIINHLIQTRDQGFLNTKSNWPKGLKVKREYFIDMVIAMNFSKAKITNRFKNAFKEDDYVWIFFESNKLEKKTSQKIKTVLSNMVKDGLVSVSPMTLELLQQSGESGTYESFKAASDIFLF